LARHYVPNPTQPVVDDDGFPAMTDDTLETLFVSVAGVIYYCELHRGLWTLVWRQVGRMR
jgi:hypothetical protein